ncbi:MAG: hypothetical protein AAFU86_02750 [Pseudomonadota bacterium]
MPDDLPAVLSHVRWIGGGSGAAKSTVARTLADAKGAVLYDTDAVMRDHADRCPRDQCPKLASFIDMTMDERWVRRTPEQMLEMFHWFAGEGFDLIVEDLLALPRDRLVIAEGFRLLPRLVAPLLGDTRHALWLLPTPAFRRRAFDARGTSHNGQATRTSHLQIFWRATRSLRTTCAARLPPWGYTHCRSTAR